jgi:hypothetical protein
MPEIWAWVAGLCAKYRLCPPWLSDGQSSCMLYDYVYLSNEAHFECARSDQNNTFQIQF